MLGSFGITGWHDEAKVRGPGITVGRSGGSFGVVTYSAVDFWPLNTALYVNNFHGNDPRFAYYLLKTFDFKGYNSGSAQPSLNRNFVHPVVIDVPPIEEQRWIGRVLGALDDKIELNRRMSETLEAMARALFNSWFVDFDPVRAKAAARDMTLPDDVGGQFSDTLINVNGEETPEGWSRVSLDSVARFLNGLPLQKYPPKGEGDLPVIKIAQLRVDSVEGAAMANASIPTDYVVEDGDVLFSWSGSLECVIWTGGRGALNQHLFKVTSRSHPKWYCYLAIHQHLDEFRRIAAAKATTMGHIQRHHLSEAIVADPPRSVLDEADKIVAPVLSRLIACQLESRQLAAIRDELLPKLISGEVRIPALEMEA